MRHVLDLLLATVCFFIVGGVIAGRIHPENEAYRIVIGVVVAGVGLRRLLTFIVEER